MGPPLIILFLFLKKYVAYNIYQAATSYGYPRIYRRLLEGLRDNSYSLAFSKEKKDLVKSALKQVRKEAMLLKLSRSYINSIVYFI